MSHFCTSTMQWLQTDWFSQTTNQRIRRLKASELTAVYAHIDQFFQAHINDPMNDVVVAMNCPHDWPPVLVPVWIACNRDEEEAAKFLGCLYCRHAIQRPEDWWSFGDSRLLWRPRRYVAHLLQQAIDAKIA